MRTPFPALMLVTGRDLGPDPHDERAFFDRVSAAIAGGVNVVQLREKDLDTEALARLACGAREVAAGRALILVNGDFEAARRGSADGLHLPETLALESGLPTGWLVGRSTHGVEAARRVEGRVDYLVAGTIYSTWSHPGSRPGGVALLKEICAATPLPVIAIGGITPDRVRECLEAGSAGVAVRSSIMAAKDPQVEARRFWEALIAAARRGYEG